jgi:Cation transporting ATPase, C-terminus
MSSWRLSPQSARPRLRIRASPFNRLLIWCIASEIAFAAALIYFPPLQSTFGTVALRPLDLAFLLPFPLVVWGADELRRSVLRRRAAGAR